MAAEEGLSQTNAMGRVGGAAATYNGAAATYNGAAATYMVTISIIMPLCGPILQAETCQIFS